MADRILFVCTGNICRSPMAACIAIRRFGDAAVRIESAGLAAPVGAPIDANARSVLAEHGLDPGDHVARQLTAAMVDAADLVLVMEKAQILGVHALAPAACDKTFLLGKWLGAVDIPDPFRKKRDAFVHVHRMIDMAVESWCRRPDRHPRRVACMEAGGSE